MPSAPTSCLTQHFLPLVRVRKSSEGMEKSERVRKTKARKPEVPYSSLRLSNDNDAFLLAMYESAHPFRFHRQLGSFLRPILWSYDKSESLHGFKYFRDDTARRMSSACPPAAPPARAAFSSAHAKDYNSSPAKTACCVRVLGIHPCSTHTCFFSKLYEQPKRTSTYTFTQPVFSWICARRPPPPPHPDEAPKKVLLGGPGNNVKVGIVGVPNVGKSSFFNILGKMNVPAENFPFCTIDPNVAIVPVPDQRFKWLCKKYKPASEVPPNMTITDIAGLVKVRAGDGAGAGAGLAGAGAGPGAERCPSAG